MKKLLLLVSAFTLVAALTACGTETIEVPVEVEKIVEVEVESLAGTYVGYSWKGESKGTTLEEASQKIQTILTINEEGVITDASMLFFKLSQGSWYTRQDSTARVSANLDVNPVAATPGSDYSKGTSMFTVDTHDMMSLYAVTVEEDGSAAFMIVEPVTRYLYEIKLPAGYDFSTVVADVTVDGTEGGFIPTVRTSGSGLMKPASWTELEGNNIFNISYFDHVMVDAGPFEGLSQNSTMQELLEAAGVTFNAGTPEAKDVTFGRHSLGGWQGNYETIENFLIGKNVSEITSLVDWSTDKWANAVNEDNFFGVDVPTGATKTAQDSNDGIAGATVRMSRESTSFQRALVEAGIISEEDVIKGRF